MIWVRGKAGPEERVKMFLALSLLNLALTGAFSPSGSVLFGQTVKAEVSTYSELFFDALKNLVMPENSIELGEKSSLNLAGVRGARRMALESRGDIYLTISTNSALAKFSREGAADEDFARNAARKKKLLNPQSLAIFDDSLVIHDQNKIVRLNLNGTFIDAFAIPNADDAAFDENGLIYIAPTTIDPQTPLVEIYSPRGKKINAFGEAFNVRHSLGEWNKRRLVLVGGDVFVIFKSLPIVRRYGNKGDLLGEFRIEDQFTAIKEYYNLKRLGEGIANPARRFGFMETANAAAVFEGSIYVISGYPILMIYELKRDGRLQTIYWKDMEEVYEPKDLAIDGAKSEIRFHVLRNSLEPILDVFSVIRNQ
jgi:hypothetical protein